MIDTIEKALSPISLAASFGFGILDFGILRYPLNKPRYCLNIFYIVIVWSVYAYALYYTTTLFSLERVFSSSLIIFVPIINLFITAISIIIIICKHKTYRQYIRKLNLVDDTLEKLGIPKEYHKIRNVTKQTLIIWFLMICATSIFDSLMSIAVFDNTRAILMPLLLNYFVYINSITDIMFILLLRYIGVRLNKINEHIEQLSKTEDCGSRCKWKKSFVVNDYYVRNAKKCKHILWTITHLHLELCRTARNINGFFGIQMTLQMISYFVVFNSMFYYEYYIILHLKEIYNNNMILKTLLSSNMWIIIYFIKLISLNHICETVSTKAQETKIIMHKLINFVRFVEIREEIYQFILQISLRPLKFSGCGLFYFGYDFIRKFFVWILTIAIFMLQMDKWRLMSSEWSKIYSRNMTYYNK